MFLIKFGKILAKIFSNIFFFCPSWTPIMCRLDYLILFHMSFWPYSVFLKLFFLIFLVWITCIEIICLQSE